MKILVDAQHMIVAKTKGRSIVLIMHKLARIPVHKVDTAVKRPHPHIILAIPVNTIQRIGSDTRVVDVIMQVMPPFPRTGIKNGETIIFCSYPEIALSILRQGIYRIIRDPGSRMIILPVVLKPARLPVKKLEPAVSAYPKTLPAVYKESRNSIVLY